MLIPLLTLMALQTATVPEANIGHGMKTNSPPPKIVSVATSPPPPTVCDPRRCFTTGGSTGGMVSNVLPSEPLVVMSPSMPGLPLVAATPNLGPGRHELVVHWPDSTRRQDYRRAFKTGAACLKARAAVLDEHRHRTSAIAVNMANRGTILAVMLEAPYAVCVPLD